MNLVELAAELRWIEVGEWPLNPFLPMKKPSEVKIGIPRSGCGFLYRPHLRRGVLYLGYIDDVVEIDHGGRDVQEQIGGVKFGVFHYEPRIVDLPPSKAIETRLKKLNTQEFSSLAALLEAGWMVD